MSQLLDPEQFDVFLAHNSKNKPAVRELKQQLVQQGLTVWFDADELRPGVPWQLAIEAGIKASRSIAVLVSNDGLSPWEDAEMQGALIIVVQDRRPVIPVLLPGASQAELPMFLRNRTWVDFTEDGLDELILGLRGVKKQRTVNQLKEPKRQQKDFGTPGSFAERSPLPPRATTLNEILPGGWRIQIQTPFALRQMKLEVLLNHLFRGERSTLMSVSERYRVVYHSRMRLREIKSHVWCCEKTSHEYSS